MTVRGVGRAWLVAAAGLGLATTARADRIVLRGGGEIKGVVVPDKARRDKVMVQTETGSKPIAFAKEQVVEVIAEPGPLDEYLKRRRDVKDTAEAQYEFGLWCEESRLTGPAENHFRRAVALDPKFGPAHKKLGHVQHGDKWMTYDEFHAAQGLIKYKGRWVSRQEKDLLDAKASLSSEQQSWARRIKILRSAILNGTDRQRAQAEAQLVAIRDPAAVTPLVQAFGRDPEPLRVLLNQLLGGIEGREASEALVNRVLVEVDSAIRSGALDELVRRREPDMVGQFTKALKAQDPAVVGRAAWALAALKVTSAVPKLLAVLVKVESNFVLDTPGGMGPSPGGMPVGFSSITPVPGVPANAPPGFSYVRSVPILLGPAVAPGAVAYGATSVPYGSFTGASLGGIDANRPVPRVVTIIHQNPAVLEALETLTGQNFGYDVDAWRRWLNNAPRPAPAPARRVPQP
jgi:hypothetical protein